jgi:hypothetical protein
MMMTLSIAPVNEGLLVSKLVSHRASVDMSADGVEPLEVVIKELQKQVTSREKYMVVHLI